jgi:C_GCAxxG_C_C family probable redox protein
METIKMKNEELLAKAFERGFEFEKKYHGCAQCAVGALYDVFPELRNEAVFRAASGLGGGLGLTCKGHCGALTGGVMVLSQLYGRELTQIADPDRKRAVAFRLGENMARKFLDEYGTIICEKIHQKVMGRSFSLLDPKDKEAFEAAGGHETACPSVVGNGVRWAAELLVEEREKKLNIQPTPNRYFNIPRST